MKEKKLFSNVAKRMRSAVVDDKARRKFQFVCVYAVLGIVSFVMTVLNVITEKGALTYATLIFAALCFTMTVLLCIKKMSIAFSEVVFVFSIYALFTYFIISGNPDGFSILWTALLPAAGMLLFGREQGSVVAFGLFAIIIFLLQVPAGRQFLQYEYSETFTQRFPLLYMAFYAIVLLLETIRLLTYEELEKLREKYKFQSCHDALTGVYNRQGFNDLMDGIIAKREGAFSLLIMDLDRFKTINDVYGHLQGDRVLISVAETLVSAAGEKGKVCRWGGEEFAVFLEDCGSGEKFAEEVREKVSELKIPFEGGEISLTTSVGEVTVEDMSATAQNVVITADRCLYNAKEAGRNMIVSAVIRRAAEKEDS